MDNGEEDVLCSIWCLEPEEEREEVAEIWPEEGIFLKSKVYIESAEDVERTDVEYFCFLDTDGSLRTKGRAFDGIGTGILCSRGLFREREIGVEEGVEKNIVLEESFL